MLAAILTSCLILTSCTKDEGNVNPDQPVILNCMKPDYLKTGDKVALISPSYFTPMENVEKTADVLRGWGLEPAAGNGSQRHYRSTHRRRHLAVQH